MQIRPEELEHRDEGHPCEPVAPADEGEPENNPTEEQPDDPHKDEP
jgi:hypothetical protein